MTKYLPGNTKRVGSPGDPVVETFWLHHDHQGSIQAITDVAGTEVQRFLYYPYGDRIATSTAHEESKGWIGERQDATGLFYLHARYYDPVIGRFNSADPSDPMAPGVGLNRYAYAGNSPVMRVDPWGLRFVGNDEDDIGQRGGWTQIRGTNRETGGLGGVIVHGNDYAELRDLFEDDFDRLVGAAYEQGDISLYPTDRGTVLWDAGGYGTEFDQYGFTVSSYGTPPLDQIQFAVADDEIDLIYPYEEGLETFRTGGPSGVGRARPRTETKPVNLPGWRRVLIDIRHIMSGHTRGGSRVSPNSTKDLFPSGMTQAQIERAVRHAYRYSNRVRTQGNQVQWRGPFGRHSIEGWVNTSTKVVRTAYPQYSVQ